MTYDPSSAKTAYHLGLCALALHDIDQAESALKEALALDSFEWVRAKPRINQVIRSVADGASSEMVRLVPSAEALAQAAEQGLPGPGLFPDSCHLNLKGAWVVAAAFLEALAPRLPAWIQEKRVDGEWPPSEEAVTRILCISPEKRKKALRDIVSNDWLLGRALLPMLEERLAELEVQGRHWEKEDLRTLYQQGLAVLPEDYRLRYEYALVLQQAADTAGALEQARRLAQSHPLMPRGRLLLASLLASQGKLEEAFQEADRLLEVYPEEAEAWLLYAQLHWKSGDSEKALAMCQRARRCNARSIMPGLQEGDYLSALGRYPEAIACWRAMRRTHPRSNELATRLDALMRDHLESDERCGLLGALRSGRS